MGDVYTNVGQARGKSATRGRKELGSPAGREISLGEPGEKSKGSLEMKDTFAFFLPLPLPSPPLPLQLSDLYILHRSNSTSPAKTILQILQLLLLGSPQQTEFPGSYKA
ncbi:hypothetical protein GOP47_0006436 [Adiantum capillus-veneris]|uniref:Uncharacterized protein n=1 Tax=Adiantum capillus-veneris TaxID=13818 RepID=A0A9D4V2W0_ADICA|nr:hypothetical protein GOP47_0006436 [Adiantum capillus-veneris]